MYTPVCCISHTYPSNGRFKGMGTCWKKVTNSFIGTRLPFKVAANFQLVCQQFKTSEIIQQPTRPGQCKAVQSIWNDPLYPFLYGAGTLEKKSHLATEICFFFNDILIKTQNSKLKTNKIKATQLEWSQSKMLSTAASLNHDSNQCLVYKRLVFQLTQAAKSHQGPMLVLKLDGHW